MSLFFNASYVCSCKVLVVALLSVQSCKLTVRSRKHYRGGVCLTVTGASSDHDDISDTEVDLSSPSVSLSENETANARGTYRMHSVATHRHFLTFERCFIEF